MHSASAGTCFNVIKVFLSLTSMYFIEVNLKYNSIEAGRPYSSYMVLPLFFIYSYKALEPN